MTGTDWIILTGFAALFFCYRFFRDWHGHREAPRRVDLQAAQYLREQGYLVQAKGAVRIIQFKIDDTTHEQDVKADLIVRRGLKKYVVEVNAKDSGSPRNADIRRRLLEYQLAFSPNGIISLDMDKKKLRLVQVNNRRFLIHLLAMATCLALGVLLYHWVGK